MKNIFKTLALSALLTIGTFAAPTFAEKSTAAQLPSPKVSEEFDYQIKTIEILGSQMAYVEQGKGEAALFLHGNPTSSYLWRNIIPYVSETHRAIAVDLIGMGHSDQPDLDYTFQDHAKYLDAFISKMGLENITLISHDWGAALAWDYARKNPNKISKIAFMEAVVPPAFPRPTYESMGKEFGDTFRAMRDKVSGHKLVIQENMFLEKLIPGLINRPIGDKAHNYYKAPYQTEKSRKVVWEWPKELPIEGKPARNIPVMTEIQKFMETTSLPVLLTYAEPGILITPETVGWYEKRIKNLETVYIGQGFHYIQEDQPTAIGRALKEWLRRTQ